MRFRTSLRYRVTLSFALLGLVVSLGLAGTLYVRTTEMEARLVAETLSTELEDYIARYAVDPETPPPASTMIRTYVIPSGTGDAPETLRDLKTGLHQLQLEGKGYYAEVRVHAGRHFIVLYDDRQIRHRENQFKIFLSIGVLVMTLLSALLGFWLAERVISPVGELAVRVAGLRPEEHRAPLAEDFPHDEVGMLAQEFDAYQQRLAAFIEREQAFTADVSHELRTPLAVIEGASEVLLDDPGLDEARRSRVERIARSAHEMSELVSALLLLAREEISNVPETGCAVAEVLRQVVEGHQHLLYHKPVEIKLDIQAHAILPVECALLRVVLANLIRNAASYTERGRVCIGLQENCVVVEDTGVGIAPEQLQRVFDRYYSGQSGGEGIGLSLVKRICQRYGWHIEIDSSGQGTRIQLVFGERPLKKPHASHNSFEPA